jgi:hypothetical protein
MLDVEPAMESSGLIATLDREGLQKRSLARIAPNEHRYLVV